MRRWTYHSEEDCQKSFFERLGDFHRRPEMLVWFCRLVTTAFLRVWLRAFHRFKVEGRENLPSHGSFVLVANHGSHLDALCLLSSVPWKRIHRTFPAAAKDYFFSHLSTTFVSSVFLNALPFDRKDDSSGSLEECRKLLARRDNILILFPEGTRNPEGSPGRFRRGIGRLVAGTDLPVVPCYLEGAARAWPKGRLVPRPGSLTLSIGEPRRYENTTTDPDGCREVAADLERAVAKLKSRRGFHTGSS